MIEKYHKENSQANANVKIEPVEEDGKPYKGGSACAHCNQNIHESFKATAHARALSVLTKKGKDRDFECLPCHVTGFGMKGGFTSFGKINRMTSRPSSLGLWVGE